MIYTWKNKLFFSVLLGFVSLSSATADSNFLKAANEYRNFMSVSPEQPFFPILILFAFICALITFFKPKFGLFFILIFMLISTDLPVTKKGEIERSVTVRIEDLLLLLVSGGWLLNRARTRSLATIKKVPVNQPILFMCVAIVISSILGIFQGTVELSRAILFSVKRLEYFWLFFMTLNILENRDDVKKAMKLVMFFSGIIALIGIFQFFIAPASPLVGGGATATVGFGRANSLASFYLLIIGLIIGVLMCSENMKRQYAYWGLLSIMIVALLLTKSRGAYVSLPPIIIAAIFISKNKKVLTLLLLFVGLYGAYSLLNMMVGNSAFDYVISRHNQDFSQQFSSIRDVAIEGPEADSSFYSRYLAWKHVMPEIFAYPIFGHGVGAMILGYVDNQYIHELYDTGVFGLLALLYLNFVVLVSAFRFYRNSSEEFDRGVALGFLLGVIGVLSHGITITNFYTILNMEAYCLILGLLMVLYYEDSKRKTDQRLEYA